MKWIFKQDEPNVRYVECLYLLSLWIDPCVLKQRKRWWGWQTVSWSYSHILAPYGMDYVIEWLDWNEDQHAPSKRKTLYQLTKNKNNENKTI